MPRTVQYAFICTVQNTTFVVCMFSIDLVSASLIGVGWKVILSPFRNLAVTSTFVICLGVFLEDCPHF